MGVFFVMALLNCACIAAESTLCLWIRSVRSCVIVQTAVVDVL